MKEQLEQIYANAVADLSKAASITDLDEIRGKYLSRKGEFNEIKRTLKICRMKIKELLVLLQMR